MKNIIQSIFTLVGGFLGWFLGGLDGVLYVLLALITIDYITGLMLGITEKRLASDIGFKGIFRKILILALVGIGNLLDVYIIKSGSTVRSACAFFYISNEAISIIENAGKMGLPIPNKLKNIINELNKEEK